MLLLLMEALGEALRYKAQSVFVCLWLAGHRYVFWEKFLLQGETVGLTAARIL